MRIGIVSDTHGSFQNLVQAVGEMGPIGLLLHAGDGARDVDRLRGKGRFEIESVRGNCDFGPYREELAFPVEGRRILLTHGHAYGVKTGLLRLQLRGAEWQADIVVYGHTHVPDNSYANGLRLVNPGSLSQARGGLYPTYAVMEIAGERIDVEICRLGKGPVHLRPQ